MFFLKVNGIATTLFGAESCTYKVVVESSSAKSYFYHIDYHIDGCVLCIMRLTKRNLVTGTGNLLALYDGTF